MADWQDRGPGQTGKANPKGLLGAMDEAVKSAHWSQNDRQYVPRWVKRYKAFCRRDGLSLNRGGFA